jgi:hypothetical protein
MDDAWQGRTSRAIQTRVGYDPVNKISNEEIFYVDNDAHTCHHSMTLVSFIKSAGISFK